MTTIANAIIYGTVSDVAREAKANEHLNFIDEYGYTPLIETCIVDDIEKAQALLKFHPDVNFPDLVGHTPLHWACDNHNIPLAKLLLELGANPNAYSLAGMPILVNPLLRQQADLKHLLISHGAKLSFAYDFINAKMLGHRFELQGYVDILNADESYVEIALEGFILEFTLDTLRKSLKDFRENFSARPWAYYFSRLQLAIDALSRASVLVRFQHYNVDYKTHMNKLIPLMSQDPLIIPVAQEGHALTLVRLGNLLAVCDRAKQDEHDDEQDKVKIYYMNKPWKLTPEYIAELMYVRQHMAAFHKMLPVNLGLHEIARMPLRPQIAGNCSWANIEASLPTLFFMVALNASSQSGDELIKDKNEAMAIFKDWQRWDQDRSLDYFVKNVQYADKKRQATIIEIVCAVLFEACSPDKPEDRKRIEKLVPIIKTPGFEYIAQSYLKTYLQTKKTKWGTDFQRMLKIGGDVFEE